MNANSLDTASQTSVMITFFQDRFKANVWRGLIGDRLIGHHIFDQSLNANRYLNFLQNDSLESGLKTSTWNLGKTSFTCKMELLLIEPELLQCI